MTQTIRFLLSAVMLTASAIIGAFAQPLDAKAKLSDEATAESRYSYDSMKAVLTSSNEAMIAQPPTFADAVVGCGCCSYKIAGIDIKPAPDGAREGARVKVAGAFITIGGGPARIGSVVLQSEAVADGYKRDEVRRDRAKFAIIIGKLRDGDLSVVRRLGGHRYKQYDYWKMRLSRDHRTRAEQIALFERLRRVSITVWGP